MQRFVQDFIFSFSSSINYCAFNNIAYWLTISFVEQWFNDFRMNLYCIHLLFLLILNDLCISSHKFLGKDPRSEKRGLKRIISSDDFGNCWYNSIKCHTFSFFQNQKNHFQNKNSFEFTTNEEVKRRRQVVPSRK